jgi:hypothetical protein
MLVNPTSSNRRLREEHVLSIRLNTAAVDIHQLLLRAVFHTRCAFIHLVRLTTLPLLSFISIGIIRLLLLHFVGVPRLSYIEVCVTLWSL